MYDVNMQWCMSSLCYGRLCLPGTGL